MLCFQLFYYLKPNHLHPSPKRQSLLTLELYIPRPHGSLYSSQLQSRPRHLAQPHCDRQQTICQPENHKKCVITELKGEVGFSPIFSGKFEHLFCFFSVTENIDILPLISEMPHYKSFYIYVITVFFQIFLVQNHPQTKQSSVKISAKSVGLFEEIQIQRKRNSIPLV